MSFLLIISRIYVVNGNDSSSPSNITFELFLTSPSASSEEGKEGHPKKK
jgi:hypothetical protein